ncbi:hypothetical protein Aph01nite_21280 [Acrocarpospora phusangensis]|uniref:Uncharacterized protein n=1 Tax=Acrocarpospora phusangensis TaxID=1070424 RepID=A0A919QAH5_9ACTN|nr:hypothetical protein [Acrocarpospora phusangensis]GIH23818.1 hypothetical protein Aph01nite_21280 [Acrocarpospora phusangensis]
MRFWMPPGRLVRVAAGLSLAAAGVLVAGAFVNSRAVREVAAPRAEQLRRVEVADLSRGNAARWVVAQVRGIVACDPPMCAELTAAGVHPGTLLPLRGPRDEVLNADVVVVTPAVRAMFGAGLDPVLAPEALARVAEIEVRRVTPEGVRRFARELARDAADRRRAGRELLGHPRLAAAPDATRQLAAGEVDARLLSALAAVAASHRLYVRAFGDAGADPGVPLRGVEISTIDGDQPSEENISGILRFFEAQQSQFHPIEVKLAQPSDAASTILRIRYSAPSPTGSLSS